MSADLRRDQQTLSHHILDNSDTSRCSYFFAIPLLKYIARLSKSPAYIGNAAFYQINKRQISVVVSSGTQVTSLRRIPKLGVPSPVTAKHNSVNMEAEWAQHKNSPGSHPLVTLNPWVPHPGFFPTVMSFNPCTPLLYRKGFKKPRVGKPFESLASLSNATIPANVGDEAEVPPILRGTPERKMR